jgi:hypothetical protein
MKFKPVIVAAAFMAAIPAFSQEKGLSAITLEESEKHMEYLSSDNLEGRRTGSEGNTTAAEYIRSAALKIGVRPLPGQDDLFQPLEYLRITPVAGESGITLKDSAGNILSTAAVTAI